MNNIPGVELDKKIGLKVMGWSRFNSDIWKFSTSWASAEAIVNRLNQHGWRFTFRQLDSSGGWDVSLSHDDGRFVCGAALTLPHALCKAALISVVISQP